MTKEERKELKVQIALGSIPYLLKVSLANDPKTPKFVLRQLAKDRDVQCHVADNPNTSVSVLRQLAKTIIYPVEYYLSQNPNTPVDVLQQLAKHEVKCC